jgi:hypothetical protein
MDTQPADEVEKLRRCFPELMTSEDVLASVEKLTTRAPRRRAVTWHPVCEFLADVMLTAGRKRVLLGVTVPAIRVPIDLQVSASPGNVMPPAWHNRTINWLRQHGYHTWTDLAWLSPSNLSMMPGLGPTTLDDIVIQALTFAWDNDGVTSVDRIGETSTDSGGGLPKPGVIRSSGASIVADVWAGREEAALLLLWRWSSSEKQVDSVGDFVRLVSRAATVWPDDVRTAITHLGEIPLRHPGTDSDPTALIIDWIGALGERARDLIRRRLFTTGPRATLDEVAATYGVSRERVRQIEGKLVGEFNSWIASPDAQPVAWRAASIREYLGPWCLVDERLAGLLGQVQHPEACLDTPEAALLLRLAGPYRRDGQYLSQQEFVLPAVNAAASETGLIDLGLYHDLLTEAGVHSTRHEAAIAAQASAMRELNGAILAWDGGVVSKAVAVLAALGRPATADEVAGAFGAGMTANRVRNALGAASGVIRSGKGMWAIATWGFEEYSGIAEEIRERLDANGGGPLPLRQLIDELVDRFGVSEASVRVYSDAPAFLVADGAIRLRLSENPYPVFTDLSRVRGMYADGRAFIVHLALDAGIIRNGSCYVHRIVAGRLGVVPGGRAVYSYGNNPVQLHWPMTSPIGPLLTGLRPVFDEQAVNPGDVLRLKFKSVDAQVIAEKTNENIAGISEHVARLRALTGLDLLSAHDIEEQVAASIEVQTSHVRDALRDRGDETVAASIPFRVTAATTNDELAAIFGDLDRDLNLK